MSARLTWLLVATSIALAAVLLAFPTMDEGKQTWLWLLLVLNGGGLLVALCAPRGVRDERVAIGGHRIPGGDR